MCIRYYLSSNITDLQPSPANARQCARVGQCWASDVDGGPTLIKHWDNVSCLLGEPVRGRLCPSVPH